MEASSGRNPEIEVLRGVAVMLVILNHVEVLLPWHHGLGWDFGGGLWCGVDLFFCISGYVIARSLLPRLRGASGEAFWREAGAFLNPPLLPASAERLAMARHSHSALRRHPPD
jgi:peptidoglycan/LPS O-acetylase OafA/YrhL